MDEILTLRGFLEAKQYNEALLLVGEMEEMARDDKISKISSYMVILLIHLIKRAVEQRTTRSWDISIRNSLIQIEKTNRRRKSGGNYIPHDELHELLIENYNMAINQASLEACEGVYTPKQLAKLVNQSEIISQAWQLIIQGEVNDDL